MKQSWLTESSDRIGISRDDDTHARNALFWSITLATVGLGLTIGFFLHGGTHGLYMDDYSEKSWAFDFVAAKWKLNLDPQFHIRSLAHIFIANLANAIPRHEFTVRLAIVAIHFLNVFLIGKLAYRVTGSRFVAISSSASFLFPIFANEALLWFAASIANTTSLSLLLIGFHCLLSCGSLKKNLLLLGYGVGAWILMVLFYEPGLFTLLLLPAFIGMAHYGRTRPDRRVWIVALAGAYMPIGIYLFFVERMAPEVAVRGGPTLNLKFILAHRVPDAVRELIGLLTYWGLSGPLPEALALGWHEWRSVLLGWALLGSFVIGCVLVAMMYPVKRETIPGSQRLARLLFVALAWILLSMVPVVLLRSQGFAIRILYTPSAGCALGAAAISGLIVNLFRQRREVFIRAILLMMGPVLFVCSLTMAGLVRTYQLRSYLDRRQLEALGPVISLLPRAETLWLLPVGLDETAVSKSWGRTGRLDEFLFGVFEISWSARDAVRLEFGGRNVQAVTSNRWEKPHMTSVLRSQDGHITTFAMQGQAVPAHELLAFTYQQDRLILLSPLELDSPDGHFSASVDLPLVAQLAQTGIKVQPCHFQLERWN